MAKRNTRAQDAPNAEPERETGSSDIDFFVRAARTKALTLRKVAVLDAPEPQVFISNLPFDGGDILGCRAGAFRFTFSDGQAVELRAGELLVIYPGNLVTIESTRPHASLQYVILNGTSVSDYFNSFGFFDRIRLKIDIQVRNFESFQRLADSTSARETLLSSLTDLIRTIASEQSRVMGRTLTEAIRTIHNNIADGIVRIQPVCDLLHVSRSHLNGLFTHAGLPNPGAFIRREQLRRACFMLRNTNTPIVEIGEAVGISSPVYFTTFIRRMTGRTPSEIRHSV